MEQTPHTTAGTARVYLVEEQANPSTDYFVMPRLSAAGLRVVRCGFDALPSAAELHGASVIFVRYVPRQWARLVSAHRSQLRRVVYFMDDDLLDIGATAGMPLRYRFKLARLAAWRKHWLQAVAAEVWVSSPWLREKYGAWQPHLLQPLPIPAASGVLRVFYHGSAAHGAEIRWLRPIMAEVLVRQPRLSFEIIGGQEVYRLYRDLPRVNVLHPMKWPAYQSFLALGERHIGLAPLLDSPFNRGRSHTKFFDITRCGAVGIYTAGSTYAECVRHDIDGVLVPNDEAAWIEAIVTLADNAPRRLALLQGAQCRQAEMGATPPAVPGEWL